MKKVKLLFFALIFILFVSFSQSGIRTDLTEFVSIEFPRAVEVTETENERIFTTNDETAMYLSLIHI